MRSKKLLDERLQARENSREGFISDFLAVDPQAFVDSFEVRRGIEPGAKARAPQDGFEKRRRRAFTVGSGNVGAGVSAVWTAKPFCKDGDVFEVKLRCRRLCRCRQLPAQGQKIANRRVVIHLNP